MQGEDWSKYCAPSINLPKKEAKYRRRVMILMQPNTATICTTKVWNFPHIYFYLFILFFWVKKIVEGRNNVRRQVEVIFKLSSRLLNSLRGGLFMLGPYH